MTILVAALLLRGADSAALAALFSATLCLVAMLRLLRAPSTEIVHLLRNERLVLFACGLFIVLALVYAARLGGAPSGDLGALTRPGQSISPSRTLEGVASFLGVPAAFLLGALSLRHPRSLDTVSTLLVFAGLVLAVFALSTLGAAAAADPRWPGRLVVRFSSPNVAADVFGVLALFSAGRLAHVTQQEGLFRRTREPLGMTMLAHAGLALSALILCLTCALLTASRGGLAALVLAIGVFAALTIAGGRGRKAGAVIAVGVVCLLAAFAADYALRRFGPADADTDLRRVMAQVHWEAFLERPFSGFGLNTFHEINAHFATAQSWNAVANIGAAHNIYIQLLEETGLIGFLVLAAAVVHCLLRTTRHARDATRRGRTWCAAAVSAAALVLIHGLVDFGLQTPALAALLAFVFGAFPGHLYGERAKPAFKMARNASPA